VTAGHAPGARTEAARATESGFLAAVGVHHAFDATPVLTDIDLALPRGALACLIGPTGCGKTTLLRVLAGFLRPDAGRVRIGGRDVTDLDPARRGIGFVYQDLALFDHMSVRGNVGFGLRARGVRGTELERRVQAMIERVGLAGFGGRRPTTLSGGQRQRVALARALVFEPDILLLDEPFAALDKNVRAQMQQEVRRLQQELGVTTILVTHDQQEAMRLADALVMMRRGRIEQSGPPRELYSRPGSVFAARFLGDANLFDGRFHASPPRVEGVVQLRLPGPVGEQGVGIADGAPVTAMIRPEDVEIRGASGPDGDTADGDDTVVDGTVEDTAFTGASTEYTVRTRDAGALVRVLASGIGDEAHARGASVRLTFPRERVSLIPEEHS
jgi:ABC-type Fe3+/spermidine/putrescine transport system ATPase subunit